MSIDAINQYCSTVYFTMATITLTSDDILKVADQSATLVNIIESRNLNQPAHVGRKELVLHDPFSELIPLGFRATIDRNTIFGHLVFGRLQIRDDL